MKHTNKEVTIYKDLYTAYDGSEFADASTCVGYEQKALQALDEKASKMRITREEAEYADLCLFTCTDEVSVYDIKTQEDYDTLKAMLFIYGNDDLITSDVIGQKVIVVVYDDGANGEVWIAMTEADFKQKVYGIINKLFVS